MVSFTIGGMRAQPHEITLVVIGIPLVKELVIMGGSFGTDGHSGNITPFAEFNIWKDPHAADQVLISPLNVVVIPLDVTHKVLAVRKYGSSTSQC